MVVVLFPQSVWLLIFDDAVPDWWNPTWWKCRPDFKIESPPKTACKGGTQQNRMSKTKTPKSVLLS
jgi:hypothetical protein